jgi:phosphatidylserine/phosphatidylglycerophosphate/cardiolipin synthase-like enzyme
LIQLTNAFKYVNKKYAVKAKTLISYRFTTINTMPQFLTTKGISSAISDIIGSSNQRLVLISPYVKIGKFFQDKLTATGQRGVSTFLICRAETLDPDQRKLLLAIPRLQLFTHSDVHAKCFYNEDHLVLGSLNFYEYSDQNNREMGISLNAKQDPQLFKEAVREGEEILQMASRTGKMYDEKKTQREKVEPTFIKKVAKAFNHQGFCIRCKDELNLNPDYPLCPDCYKSWAQWGNPDFEEKYCHCCGKKQSTSLNKPLCKECWKNADF